MSNSTTYLRHDGGAPAQASISWDNRVASPSELKASGRSKFGVYPETPARGAHSILIGDVLLAPVKHSNREHRYSKESMGVFSSFAGQRQPDPEGIDDYCQNFIVAGLAKNTLTNPDDANYMATQGTPRPNSSIVAAYIDGGWGTVYTNQYPVNFGDLLIWEPPTPDYSGLMTGPNSKVVSNKKERMVAKLRPLDWTAYSNYYNKIGVYLIQYSSQNQLQSSDLLTGNRFGKYRENREAKLQAALNTKRKSLVDAACTIKILQNRGYLDIITPHESKKKAALELLYQTVNIALTRPGMDTVITANSAQGVLTTAQVAYTNGPDANTANTLAMAEIVRAFLELKDVLGEIKDNSEYDEMTETESVVFSNEAFVKYHKNENVKKYYKKRPRDEEHFSDYRLGEHEYDMAFDLPAIAEMKTQKDTSFNWLTTVLGLGSNSKIQEHNHVTHDIIRMTESRHLLPEDTDIYLMNYKTYTHGLKTGDIDELSFIQHVRNSPVGMWVSWEMLKKAIESRIVGRASSIASGAPSNIPSQDQRIDFTMGPHYI